VALLTGTTAAAAQDVPDAAQLDAVRAQQEAELRAQLAELRQSSDPNDPALNIDLVEPLGDLANVLMDRGAFDEARALLEEAADISCRNGTFNGHRADCRHLSNQLIALEERSGVTAGTVRQRWAIARDRRDRYGPLDDPEPLNYLDEVLAGLRKLDRVGEAMQLVRTNRDIATSFLSAPPSSERADEERRRLQGLRSRFYQVMQTAWQLAGEQATIPPEEIEAAERVLMAGGGEAAESLFRTLAEREKEAIILTRASVRVLRGLAEALRIQGGPKLGEAIAVQTRTFDRVRGQASRTDPTLAALAADLAAMLRQAGDGPRAARLEREFRQYSRYNSGYRWSPEALRR
jgi:tetratricopeptide (TPR) repeat protein